MTRVKPFRATGHPRRPRQALQMQLIQRPAPHVSPKVAFLPMDAFYALLEGQAHTTSTSQLVLLDDFPQNQAPMDVIGLFRER